jgi:hypothetical protein
VASKVLGVVNETLENNGLTASEARATVFRSGIAKIETSHSTTAAVINQQQRALLEEINQILGRRYGGPTVNRLSLKLGNGDR